MSARQTRKNASGRAEQYLRKLLGTTPQGARIPPVRILAQQARVSLVTMWKAVRKLRDEGRVDGGPGTGMYVISRELPACEEMSSPLSPQVWTRLAARMESDLLTRRVGIFDRVASIKSLCTVYGGNYRTMRRAIGILVARRLIVPHGRGYCRAPEPTVTGKNTILIFAYCEHDRFSIQYLDQAYLGYIEAACRRKGCTSDIIRYTIRDGKAVFTYNTTGNPLLTFPTDRLLGCLWIALFNWEIHDDCFNKLLSLGCPVAMLDRSEDHGIPQFFSHNRAVRIFHGVEPGREASAAVASRLIQLGHRHVAFFTVEMARSYAQDRWKGLSEVYKAAGSGFDAQRFSVQAHSEHEGDHHVYDYSHLGLEYIAEQVPVHAHMSRDLLRQHLAETAQDSLVTSYYRWEIVREMEPLCRQALADESITAWVCSDDFEALAALSFLNRNNIGVPGKISLVGFNNSLEALKNNLTSYSPDLEIIMNSMVDYVIRPDWPSIRPSMAFAGTLVERGTTGVARKRYTASSPRNPAMGTV